MGVFRKAQFIGLIALLLLTIGIVSACKVPSTDQPTPTPTVSATVQPGITPTATPDGQDVVEVVYFHRAQRCSGCIHAQDMIEYTLETHFADETASGEVVFMALNLQDSANADMVQKFGAYTSSLFLNDVENGVDSIDEVTDIWFVLWDDEEFVDIVKAEIEERLAD
ncbi:MAG: nitrophenyl compound nitroreductase subunit ArsF family protein [Chloroflexota bacterium]|nr:nitrophenyl compound nitroreductase subunit ArsF family protein [Chloroflexota bacterium]